MKNRITQLFNIEHPLVQAGMVWCAPWELASAVSNAGGLGIIGGASMDPPTLRTHIQKCKAATDRPFAVNLPLVYKGTEEKMGIIMEEGVPIVFSSAGSPKKWTPVLKEKGIKVVHVVSSAKFAKKSEEAGVDAVVAEGFEAGGHNGREETTTMCLVPLVRKTVEIPLLAAGGIGSGSAMLAAMALGADGVQIGSRFVASEESSAHPDYKKRIVGADEGDTVLTLKELVPTRMIKNDFYEEVQNAYERCASQEELKELLGKGRSRKGMFEGDLARGELEIGQVSATVGEILPAASIVERILDEFREAQASIKDIEL